MKKAVAVAVLSTMLLGVLPMAMAIGGWKQKVDTNEIAIASLKKKLDDLHWYFIRKNNIIVPITPKEGK